MWKILAVKILVLTVAISIGPLVASLSVELFAKGKAKVTGDISYSIGNYSRGRTDCLGGCDPNDRDGTGPYRGITAGRVQTKAYDDGAKSIDVSLVEAQVCSESKIACFKGALSEGLDYNVKKNTYSVLQPRPFYGKSIGSNKIGSMYSLSLPKVIMNSPPYNQHLISGSLR